MKLLIEAIKQDLRIHGIAYKDIQYREIDGCKAIEIFKQDTFLFKNLMTP